MMNVIIGEELYDKEFVSKYTVGFNELAEHVKAYSPELVQEITSVNAEKIKEAARIFATHRPGCIVQGTNSLDQTSSGFQNSRGVAILQAITGNVDVLGGFVQIPRLRVNIVEETKKVSESPIGIKEYPVFYGIYGRNFGEGQTMILLESILSGQPYQVNSMIIDGSNPVLTWPNSNKVEKALSKLKFLVVMDQFMSKTARLAHLVLPAATFLERTELCDYYNLFGDPYVMIRKKVLEYGQCRSDLDLWLDLARRLGYQEDFPWSDEVSLVNYMLEPSGFTYQSLIEQYPDGYSYAQRKYKSYEQQKFKTPSGKIELYSQGLLDLGYSPLPDYQEPPESKTSTPELAEKYPLILTTGARKVYYTHSQHRHIPSLIKKAPEPLAKINPVTAGQYGLRDMDMAIVESPRGEIEIKINVTEAILPGIINIPHGWEEANANVLTNNTPADQITGYPALKGLLCNLRRKS
jgi:anaerobic selenocysteine-containing dehydrogenase